MIKITEIAAEKLKEMVASKPNPDAQMLRISFAGYGWGGPRLGLALDEQKNEDDLLVEANGIKVVYSKDLEPYVRNLALDYGTKWYNKGFHFVGNNIGSCW